jgi:tetratricopeptide (TPR) repeat protein
VVLAHNRRFEEAVAIVSALGDRPLALRVRALACRGTGDLDGALELFRRALDRCTERDDNLRAALANDIGAVNGTLGNHAVAEPWFRRSVSYADRNTSFTQALNIPIALVAQGRPEDAVRPARHALVLAERVGKLVPYAYTTHAIVAALAGRSEEARRYGDAALAMARLDRCTVLRPLQASIREARSEEPVIQAFLDALRAAMEEAYTSKHATCRGGP